MNYLVLTQFLCFRLVTLPTAKFKLCLVKISSVCWKQRYVSKLLNISNITVFYTNKVFQKTAKRSLFGRTSRCWISWSNILSSGWSDFTIKSLNGEKTKKQNRHNEILRHSFVSKSNSLFHYFDQLAMTDSFVRLKSRKIPLLLRLSVNLTRDDLPVEILGTSQDNCLLEDHPFLLF